MCSGGGYISVPVYQEIWENIGHGDHMVNVVHIESLVFFLSYGLVSHFKIFFRHRTFLTYMWALNFWCHDPMELCVCGIFAFYDGHGYHGLGPSYTHFPNILSDLKRYYLDTIGPLGGSMVAHVNN